MKQKFKYVLCEIKCLGVKKVARKGFVGKRRVNGKWAMIYRRRGGKGYVANLVKKPRRKRRRR